MNAQTPAKSVASAAKTGAYCLANDEALEWFQGFVRSFRKFNPTLPLTVIPYNTSVARLRALQAQFQFTLMDESASTRFDVIAHRVAGQHIAGGTFRKLICFFGTYDTFIFLDSDIVVTQNLDALFQAFGRTSYDFVYFDADMSMVYRPEFAQKMIAEYHSPGFNSGAFISRRDAVSEDEIMAAVESGEKVRSEFSIWGEQPFLNYLFDVTRRRLASANTLLPELAAKVWVKIPITYNSAQNQYVDGTGHPLPFIHWPGCEYPTMVRPEIFLRHRTLGMGFGEAACYRLNFYYRRYWSSLKYSLIRSKLFSGLREQRDRRIREKRRRATPAA